MYKLLLLKHKLIQFISRQSIDEPLWYFMYPPEYLYKHHITSKTQ